MARRSDRIAVTRRNESRDHPLCRNPAQLFQGDAMSFVDELERLSALREKDAITAAEFEQAKARLLQQAEPARSAWPPVSGFPAIRRSISDRWLGGVCGGLARVTETESWLWRLIFTAGLVFGGVTALIYLLLLIFVPQEDSAGRALGGNQG